MLIKLEFFLILISYLYISGTDIGMNGQNKMKYILQLGSNIENRLEYIDKTSQLIEKELGKIIKRSAIYESEAWGDESLNDFLNQIVVVESNFMPFAALRITQNIEKKIGRTKKQVANYENRVIDIDILFVENFIIRTQELTIPHGKIPQRAFILIPLVELFPQMKHPLLFLTSAQLLDNCEDNLWVRRLV